MDLSPHDAADRRVRAALVALAAGRPVVVVDDADRENEGDLVFAASLATPQLVAFTVRHTSGFVCVALPEDECDRLALPPMHHDNADRFRTAYRVTVDLVGTGTGISAAARAATIAALGTPTSTARDFVRPGHVVPLMARAGGVLVRPGHTESAVDLTRLAGLAPAGALCEIVSRDAPGEMARGPELERFAEEHDLVLLSVADIVGYRRRTEQQVQRVVTTSLPTAFGAFHAVGYLSHADGAEHMALVAGRLDALDSGVPVHVHTQCLSGDVLRSTLCGCRRSLDDALRRFSADGRGVVVYLRPAGGTAACALLDGSSEPSPVLASAVDAVLADLGVHGTAAPTGPAHTRPAALATARARRTVGEQRIAG